MISNFLVRFPEVKYAMLGNIEGKLGVKFFMPILLDVNQPALEALIANIPPVALMNAVKNACTAEEKKIIDQNKSWFDELKALMIEELRADMEGGDDDDEEDDEEGDEEEVADVKATVKPAPSPSPVPAPIQPEVPGSGK
jgi:Ran GTPase-activating protein (RanGAP) involved in mRNA processing and transport